MPQGGPGFSDCQEPRGSTIPRAAAMPAPTAQQPDRQRVNGALTGMKYCASTRSCTCSERANSIKSRANPFGTPRVTRLSGRDSGKIPLRTFPTEAAIPSSGNSLIGVPCRISYSARAYRNVADGVRVPATAYPRELSPMITCGLMSLFFNFK